jgi:uncharacterized membrane protein
MKKQLLLIFLFLGSCFFVNASDPFAPFSDPFGQNQGVLGIISLAQNIVSKLAPLLVGIAVLAFFWYLIQFIWSGKDGDGEKRKGSMAGMGYSIFAIFVMVSIWGIVYFIAGIVGVTPGGTMSGFKLPGEQ